MIILIEIAFALAFLGLFVKAIIETVWGAILMVYGLTLYTLGYTIKFLSWISRAFKRNTLA